MATNRFIGGAPEIAQVQDYLFGGTWEADDVVICKVGNVQFSTTTGSTVITTLIDTLVTAWNALSTTAYPQFTGSTSGMTASRSGNNFRLTAKTAGVPFVCTLSTTEAGGGAADLQTIDGATSSTGTTSTANSGPESWSVADNWSLGAVPVATDDVILENYSGHIKYGLAQGAIALTSLTHDMSFTGDLGLPADNPGGYPEYRETFLAIRPGTLRIGVGIGPGSSRTKIDTGTAAAATIYVYNTGAASTEDGLPALLLKGAHASNSLTILKGRIGLCFYDGETANYSGGFKIGYQDALEGDAVIFSGAGVTIGTLDVLGGTIETNSNITTLNVNAGQVTHNQGTCGTLTCIGGHVVYNSTGTLTTGIVARTGWLDFDKDPRAKTVTNPIDVYGSEAKLWDHNKVVGSLVVDMNYQDLGENHPIQIGTNFRITRGAVA